MRNPPPPKTKQPLARLIKDGCLDICPNCGSSEKRSFLGFGRILGCIQPDCKNYYRKDKGVPSNPRPVAPPFNQPKENGEKVTQEEVKNKGVCRLEVIGKNGREFVKILETEYVDDVTFQDGGKTMKIFLKDRGKIV